MGKSMFGPHVTLYLQGLVTVSKCIQSLVLILGTWSHPI